MNIDDEHHNNNENISVSENNEEKIGLNQIEIEEDNSFKDLNNNSLCEPIDDFSDNNENNDGIKILMEDITIKEYEINPGKDDTNNDDILMIIFNFHYMKELN